MESAVGWNSSVFSFLGFLCKGLALSFLNAKSTQFLGFLFCASNTSEMRKSKIRNWHTESRVPCISYFECAHFMYVFLCQSLKPMIS